MANLVNGMILKARVYCTLQEQTAITTLFYRVHTVVGTPTDQDAATNLDDGINAAWKSTLVAAASYRGVGMQIIFPLPPFVEVYNTLNAGAGGVAGEVLPKQTSGLITKRTMQAGRRFRGRAYIPFPSEGSNDANGQPTAGYLASLNALAALLDNALAIANGGNTAVGQPCLWRPVGAVATDITVMAGRVRWATQRRRGDFGATNASPI